MTALPENQLEVMQTFLSMIEPSAKETGCLSYDVFHDIEDKNQFNLLQKWETRADLNQHLSSHRFGVLLGTKALLNGPPNVEIHTVSRSEGMEAVNAARSRH